MNTDFLWDSPLWRTSVLIGPGGWVFLHVPENIPRTYVHILDGGPRGSSEFWVWFLSSQQLVKRCEWFSSALFSHFSLRAGYRSMEQNKRSYIANPEYLESKKPFRWVIVLICNFIFHSQCTVYLVFLSWAMRVEVSQEYYIKSWLYRLLRLQLTIAQETLYIHM